MERILVPTDLSENAETALKYALQLSRSIGLSEIYLLNATSVPVNPGDTFVPVTTLLLEDSQKLMADYKQKVESWEEAKGFTIHVHSEVDDAVTAIRNYADKIKPDLIIMGTKGASGIGEFLFGTVSAATLDHSEYPVLVIPGKTTYRKPESFAFFADLKTLEIKDSLRVLKNLCIALEAELHLVHVSDDAVMDENEIKEKKALLEYFHGLKMQFHVITSESIYTGMEIFMYDFQPDIVAVLSRRYSFFERIFKTSMSKRVAHRTFLPLLSMKEKEA
ncbi:MAG: universal stress protein [Flavobacteriales bacterium]|nr:universal stress protein [Flavobacteriales bacterium]